MASPVLSALSARSCGRCPVSPSPGRALLETRDCFWRAACLPGMTQHGHDAHYFESKWHPQVDFRTSWLSWRHTCVLSTPEGCGTLPSQWGFLSAAGKAQL